MPGDARDTHGDQRSDIGVPPVEATDDAVVFMDRTARHLFGLVLNRVNRALGLATVVDSGLIERFDVLPWRGRWLMLHAAPGQTVNGDSGDLIGVWVSAETYENKAWRGNAVAGFVAQVVDREDAAQDQDRRRGTPPRKDNDG